MSQAPYMPLFVDAYVADTGHLSTEENGAYLLLLMAMWRRGGTVPDDDRDNSRIVGLSRPKWRATKERLRSLLTFENGEISQKRLKKEWEHVALKRQKMSENGSKGGRPAISNNNDLAKAEGSENEKQTESTYPYTYPYREEEEKKEGARKRDAETAYAFIGRVIRLKHGQLDQWRKAYHAIPDIVAEINKADDYYSENEPKGGKWFFPVSRWLADEHEKHMKANAPKPDPMDRVFAAAR